ncbi:hypothetical protein DEO23_02760 [Brachybacterium endophyticum]|uniref:Tat pathway signal sequence domain protein n=1 Tax=Brachybacterium endophyticum TaxID=2182385 RepID=A0A2U2RNX4_9MICO|nr:hypothetical protein [Brachybacterium endophyticum]PWH07567.1 hypothetical protein DEO23_02760 [Brachybacterium endophyticum]
MTPARSTRTISRSAFLRSSLALTGGALAGTGLVTSAQAAPAGPGGEHTRSSTGDVKLPDSWEGTIFTDPLRSKLDGYISSHAVLYDSGPIAELSPANIKKADGVVNFTPYGEDPQVDQYDIEVSETARLDGGPVSVSFADDDGIETLAEAQLVRTANPQSRALLLHVLGTRGWSVLLPPKASIVESATLAESPADVTMEEATTIISNAVGFSFGEDGPNPVRVRDVSLMNDGKTIVGRVSYPSGGTRVTTTWYGTAVRGNDMVTYLLGELPEGS